jgi:hypothetical protein
LTTSELSSAWYNDADVNYTVSGSTLTIRNTTTLVIDSGETYTATILTADDVQIDGTLVVSQLNLYGDITNAGTFTNSTHTKIYDDCSLVGDFDFPLLGFMTPSQTITFENGNTYSFTNLTSAGTAGNEVVLQSDSAGDTFTLDNLSGGSLAVNYLDITDCEVDTDDVVAYHSVNNGGNDNREATPHLVFPVDINAFVLEYSN